MDLRLPPLLLAVLLAAAIVGVDLLLPGLRVGGAWRLPLAAALAGAGAGCCLAGIVAFRGARTTVDPRDPARASSLVVRGIYRRTRNPMYLGMLLVIAGVAAWRGQPAGLLALPFWVWYLGRFQIPAEEAALHRLFGAAYAAYCAQVRRWI